MAAGYSRRAGAGKVVDYLGLMVSLPAAAAVFFVVLPFDSSKISVAATAILFLVCVISACAGLLMSFWMRSSPLLWLVRVFCAGWLGICAWGLARFVIHAAGFSH